MCVLESVCESSWESWERASERAREREEGVCVWNKRTDLGDIIGLCWDTISLVSQTFRWKDYKDMQHLLKRVFFFFSFINDRKL